MKRLSFLLAFVFLFSVSVVALPAGDQTITLTMVDDTLSFVAATPATYWDTPTLRPGERVLSMGSLTLLNDTDTVRDITFEHVAFPYHDEEFLLYLNHLHLTVEKDGHVLYDAPYSHINNPEEKPNLDVVLDAGERCTYAISLRCDYTYTGMAYTTPELLEWQFSTPVEPAEDIPVEAPTPPIADPLYLQWSIAALATICIFVILIRRQKEQ